MCVEVGGGGRACMTVFFKIVLKTHSFDASWQTQLMEQCLIIIYSGCAPEHGFAFTRMLLVSGILDASCDCEAPVTLKCLLLISLCTTCLSSASTRMSLVLSIFDVSCEAPVTFNCFLLVSLCTSCFSSVSARMALMILTALMQSPEPQQWMTRMWPSR